MRLWSQNLIFFSIFRIENGFTYSQICKKNQKSGPEAAEKNRSLGVKKL